ncbi:MAG: FecR family protein [Agriterribacter sp.]
MPESFSSYDALIERFIANRLQPDELDKFFLFLEQSHFRERYGERIEMELLEQEFAAWSDSQQANRVYEQIIQKAGIQPQSLHESIIENDVPVIRSSRSFYKTFFRWAAVFILCAGAAWYYFTQTAREKRDGIAEVKVVENNEIMPGSDKAVLTLASGKKIELDDSTGTITDDGLSIDHQNGRLSYKNTKVFTINTMTTPVGGQYRLTLADGTKVWLNAASSITFPTAFPNKTREVSVTGEVYFEVAKNPKQPFKVSFNNQQVEVLGTTFNINSYPEEVSTKTTLVEGLIRISHKDQQLVLRPNEQAIAHKQLVVNKSPDILQVLAWKNGTFNFNGQDFAESMRQLERWYEIKVVYDGRVPTEKLGGEIDRSMTLNQALKVLNGIVANFKLDGKVLHVLPTP